MRLSMIAAAIALGLSAYAAVDYLPERDLLWVTDYPADLPCTPELLARVDRAFGWGKVQYDQADQTCTVACNLWIGRNDAARPTSQSAARTSQRDAHRARGAGVHSTFLLEMKRQKAAAARIS